MAREQHAALAVGDKGKQLIKQFLACHGIEARGGFVQNKQLGIVAERTGKLQFHAHAAGEVLDLCPGIEAKSVDESGERFATPRGVRRAYEPLDLAYLERGGERTRVQDKTDAGAQVTLCLAGRVGATALPKQVHLADIEFDKPKRGANSRRLAGTVYAHKADDLAGIHGKRDVAQRKTVAHTARYTFEF